MVHRAEHVFLHVCCCPQARLPGTWNFVSAAFVACLHRHSHQSTRHLNKTWASWLKINVSDKQCSKTREEDSTDWWRNRTMYRKKGEKLSRRPGELTLQRICSGYSFCTKLQTPKIWNHWLLVINYMQEHWYRSISRHYTKMTAE